MILNVKKKKQLSTINLDPLSQMKALEVQNCFIFTNPAIND